jgi:arginyl-tRNA--protein-N-Asp/Glu arginylyltransferase
MFAKGWSRCGDILYRTIYEKTCCKLYQPRLNINNFKLSNEQKKIMKRFRKFLSGEYEPNKLKAQNKDKKPEKIKIEDNFQNAINQKVQNFMNSINFLDALKKFIDNEKDLELILNSIKETKIRRNTNKKFDFNYSCDLFYIIIKMINSIKKNDEQKNTNNIIINEEKNKNKNLVNILYGVFIEYYNPVDEIVNINEETGHINFKIKDQEKYKLFLNPKEKPKENDLSKDLDILSLKNDINNDNKILNKKNISKDKKKQKEKIPKEKYIFDYFPEIVNEPEIYLPLKHIYTMELTDKITLLETEERFLLYNKYQKAVHNENSSLSIYNLNLGLSILEK